MGGRQLGVLWPQPIPGGNGLSVPPSGETCPLGVGLLPRTSSLGSWSWLPSLGALAFPRLHGGKSCFWPLAGVRGTGSDTVAEGSRPLSHTVLQFQKFLSEVEEAFQCICCQELVFRPVTTACQHNVCKVRGGRGLRAPDHTVLALPTSLGP